jgi:hypothetical protein
MRCKLMTFFKNKKIRISFLYLVAYIINSSVQDIHILNLMSYVFSLVKEILRPKTNILERYNSIMNYFYIWKMLNSVLEALIKKTKYSKLSWNFCSQSFKNIKGEVFNAKILHIYHTNFLSMKNFIIIYLFCINYSLIYSINLVLY